jgi:hypothetical protein
MRKTSSAAAYLSPMLHHPFYAPHHRSRPRNCLPPFTHVSSAKTRRSSAPPPRAISARASCSLRAALISTLGAGAAVALWSSTLPSPPPPPPPPQRSSSCLNLASPISWGRTALKCAMAQGKKSVAAYLRRCSRCERTRPPPSPLPPLTRCNAVSALPKQSKTYRPSAAP